MPKQCTVLTTEVGETSFIHLSDFTGHVDIVSSSGAVLVTVPITDLLLFAQIATSALLFPESKS